MQAVLQAITIGLPYACFVGVTHVLWPRVVRTVPDQHPLDALRGLCASLVFTAHALKTPTLVETGSPFGVPGEFNPVIQLGDAGVVLFFYITGYLFFGSAYPPGTDLRAALGFVRRRLRRLAPAFLFTATVALVLHAISTDLPLSSAAFVRDALHIYSFGMYLGRLPNEDPLMWLAINITWSLKFEWKFYFLIAISMALPGRKWTAVGLLMGLVGFLMLLERSFEASYMGYLLAGGYASVAVRRPYGLPVPALVCLGLGNTSAALSYLVFSAFLLIRQLPSWLRPLTTAGNVTYSYYLIHGSVLLLVHALCAPWLSPAGLDRWEFYLFLALGACTAACVALVMYRCLEAPYFRGRQPQAWAAGMDGPDQAQGPRLVP